MDHSNYLLLRIPGRGQVTLSLPGVERGLRNERLPRNSEALQEFEGTWVPLATHPSVSHLFGVEEAPPDLSDEPVQFIELSPPKNPKPREKPRRTASWLERLPVFNRWMGGL
jgi:hypothetical protein